MTHSSVAAALSNEMQNRKVEVIMNTRSKPLLQACRGIGLRRMSGKRPLRQKIAMLFVRVLIEDAQYIFDT